MKISDLCITNGLIHQEIADKILDYHIRPMEQVEKNLSLHIWASMKSGYRPTEYEWSRGRTGNSQHTFQGQGAVDWTCDNFKDNKDRLVDEIIKTTEYKRIAVYKGFVHCDYKGDEYLLFSSDNNSNWKYIKHFK